MNRYLTAVFAICFFAIASGEHTHAQQKLSRGDVVNSLAGAGQAAQASGVDIQAIRADIERRIRVEGTENAASPPPALQALEALPYLTVEVQFALNSDWIRPLSWGTMGDIAEALHHPLLMSYKFAVVGHTDATGSRETNLKLSQRRAEAARKMLIETFGIDPGRLEAVGFGEEQLADPQHPDAAENRRVQLLNIGPL